MPAYARVAIGAAVRVGRDGTACGNGDRNELEVTLEVRGGGPLRPSLRSRPTFTTSRANVLRSW